MLASADNVAGSKQFLNHLHKKQSLAAKTQERKDPVSASAFLSEQKKLIDERKKVILIDHQFCL